MRNESMKKAVLGAALWAGISVLAHAQDNSISRLGGDSYAYFNGPVSSAPATKSGWRQRQMDACKREIDSCQYVDAYFPYYHQRASKPEATWRQSHPNGRTLDEFQALSSDPFASRSTAPKAGPVLPGSYATAVTQASSNRARVAP